MKGEIEILRLCFICCISVPVQWGDIYIYCYILYLFSKDGWKVNRFFLMIYILIFFCSTFANIMRTFLVIFFYGLWRALEPQILIIYLLQKGNCLSFIFCHLNMLLKRAFPLWNSLLFPPSSSHAFKSLHV